MNLILLKLSKDTRINSNITTKSQHRFAKDVFVKYDKNGYINSQAKKPINGN